MQEKRKKYGTLGPSHYSFIPSEDFSKAAANPDFAKLLQFLGIEQSYGSNLKMPSANFPLPYHPVGWKAWFVDKLAKENLPDEMDFFDLDLQDDLAQLKALKRFLEETEKILTEDSNKKSRNLDTQIVEQFEDKPDLLRLLLCLEFEPPIEGDAWRILREVSLKPKLNFLQRIIHLTVSNDKICKGCQDNFRNLLLHLDKKKNCREKYSDEDFHDMREASKHFRQINTSVWRKENKEKIAKRMAERYQRNKEAIKAQPKDVEKQKASYSKYYKKARKEIAVTRRSYYDKNKEKYSEKYEKKRLEKWSENHNQEAFEKYKIHFSTVFRDDIDHFEKHYINIFMKNIDKLMAKSDQLEMQQLILAEESIAKCKKQLEDELKSGEDEVAKTSFVEEVKKILHRVDKAMENEKSKLLRHLGNVLRKMCHENYEDYVCPECIQNRRGRCSSCSSFAFKLKL